jgi:hypothetical protein
MMTCQMFTLELDVIHVGYVQVVIFLRFDLTWIEYFLQITNGSLLESVYRDLIPPFFLKSVAFIC